MSLTRPFFEVKTKDKSRPSTRGMITPTYLNELLNMSKVGELGNLLLTLEPHLTLRLMNEQGLHELMPMHSLNQCTHGTTGRRQVTSVVRGCHPMTPPRKLIDGASGGAPGSVLLCHAHLLADCMELRISWHKTFAVMAPPTPELLQLTTGEDTQPFWQYWFISHGSIRWISVPIPDSKFNAIPDRHVVVPQ